MFHSYKFSISIQCITPPVSLRCWVMKLRARWGINRWGCHPMLG